jgi:hypothetical protein
MSLRPVGPYDPTMTRAEDRDLIIEVVLSYGALLDAGRLEDVAALFAHSTYRTEGSAFVLEGSDAVLAAQRHVVKMYDGVPRTHHNITNFRVDFDGSGDGAVCHAYYTVIQALPGEEPRIILTGRYEDAFERTDGDWRFADRLTYMDQVGRLDGHLHLDRIDMDL